jgi:hypothetical protein
VLRHGGADLLGQHAVGVDLALKPLEERLGAGGGAGRAVSRVAQEACAAMRARRRRRSGVIPTAAPRLRSCGFLWSDTCCAWTSGARAAVVDQVWRIIDAGLRR